MNQNLNLYYIFYITAKYKNISAASKALYISQPAVSKSISRLEKNLEAPLFTRSSKGVALTPEGSLLFERLDDAFSAISDGEELIRQRNELGIGQISIGVSTTLCKYILLPYLNRFIQENPHVKLSIFCQSTYQTIEALQKGAIDIGLIGEPTAASRLAFRPVMEIEDIFVTTDSYLEHLKLRAEGGRLSDRLEDMMDQGAFLMLDRENLTRQHIDRYLSDHGLLMKQVIEVTTMDLLVEFAKINLGIACVIKSFVAHELAEKTLKELPLATPIPPRTVGFACLRKNLPALDKFLPDK